MLAIQFEQNLHKQHEIYLASASQTLPTQIEIYSTCSCWGPHLVCQALHWVCQAWRWVCQSWRWLLGYQHVGIGRSILLGNWPIRSPKDKGFVGSCQLSEITLSHVINDFRPHVERQIQEIALLSHVELKKWLCRPVDFRVLYLFFSTISRISKILKNLSLFHPAGDQ